MPTYIYETIESRERFELRQKFDEPALTTHPQTGEPVRRLMSGGLTMLTGGMKSADAPQHGCGPATCQCGKFN